MGLLALMRLHDSRRAARADAAGDLILLEDQDRGLWDQDAIAEGCGLAERALKSRRFGPYSLQAAIAAVHAEAPSFAQTDWLQIAALYDVLVRADPPPIVRLNRAVARGFAFGFDQGLAALDVALGDGALDTYHLAHAARADLLRRLGRREEARASYERALELARQEPERRFLQRRVAELS